MFIVKDCTPSHMTVGDGLDNDCDGRVDEEVCYDFKGAYTAIQPKPGNKGSIIMLDGIRLLIRKLSFILFR